MSSHFDDQSHSADSSAAKAGSSDDHQKSAITGVTVRSAYVETASHPTVRSPVGVTSGDSGKLGPHRTLGDFELIQELGRGGMGVVYEARQRSLDKRVAVKVLPYSAMLDKRSVKRFQNEAWASARLQHRNIVPVYQVGNENDVYFYAMRYIDGGDLNDLLKSLRAAARRDRSPRESQAGSPPAFPGKKLSGKERTSSGEQAGPAASDRKEASDTPSPQRDSTRKSGWSKGDTLASRQLLDLVEKNRSTSIPQFWAALVSMGIQVAEALHYAHETGIIHRDIKPSNLLLDTDGEVWVADFGLAQIQNDTGLTATGALVGTLRYMSPEQALGKRVGVDHRTDVYSLGVTLYELLTLTRAFSGSSREIVLRKITFDSPTRPRKIDRRIPVELETIVMKAMSKNPVDRYQTAAELAEDLRLFRDDKPIKGRKPTIPQHLVRWARRNRTVVGSMAALLAVTFIASVLVATISWNLFASTAAALETEKEQKAAVERLLDRSEGLRLAANSAIELEGNPTRALLLAIEGARRYPGVDTNGAILEALDDQHEFLTLAGHPGPVGHLAFNADGTTLISAATRSRFDDGPDAAILWDTETGKSIGELKDEKTITSAVFSPDKFRILTASSPSPRRATDDVDGELVGASPSLWDSVKIQKLLSFDKAFLFEAHAGVFDPEGRRAVFPSLGHTAIIYDCVAGHELVPLAGHDKRVVFAAFSPQGDRVVTASDDNTVRVWDADSGAQVFQFNLWKDREPAGSQCVVDSVAFRADGLQLVTGSRKYGIHLWDLANGQRINDDYLAGGIAEYWPSGWRLLTRFPTGRDMTMRDVSAGEPLGTVNPDVGLIRQAVIGPNGRWIATQGHSDSRVVSLWSAADGQVTAVLRGHHYAVNDMAFSPDSKMIATASSDKTVKLWHVADGRDRATFSTQPWSIDPLAVASPDGKQLAITGLDPDMVAQVVDFQRPDRSTQLLSRIWMPNFTSTRFAASRGDRLSIHSVADAVELNSITNAFGPFYEAAINFNGDRVAAFGGGDAITLWFPDQNRRKSLLIGDTQVFSLKFNRRGDRLFAACGDGYVHVWDTDTGQLLDRLANDGKVYDVVLSPDETELAAVTNQNRVSLWDMESFDKLQTLQSPEMKFDSVAYSFDGKRLVTFQSSGSDSVQVWDVASGKLESTLDATGQVHVATHPAENEALITSTEEGAVIWQYVQNVRRPITEAPMIHGAFSSDGSEFVIGSALPLPEQPWLSAPTSFAPSKIERWSREDLRQEESVEIAAGSISDFYLSGDGRALVNNTRRFGVVNHDVATHQPTANIPGHAAPISATMFTSDSLRLITASWDQTISIWNAANGEKLKTFVGHNSPVNCLAITGDDRWLASGADDGKCIVWNLDSGEIIQRLDVAQSSIRHVALDSAGNRLLAITSEDSIHFFDVETGQRVDLDVGAGQIAWAEYSPDGSLLLVIPKAADLDRPENQRAGDENPDHQVLIVPINGNAITPIVHDGPIVTAHFDATGERVVSATQTGTVTLRNVKSGQVEATFSKSGFKVSSAALNKSGDLLAVAGPSRVTIWKVDEAKEWVSVPSWRLYPKPPHRYDPFIPDAQKIFTQRIDTGGFRDWPIEPLEFAASRSPRRLSTDENARFLIEQRPITDD